MGAKEVQSTVCVGDGALRILGLLRSSQGSPPDIHWSAANNDWIADAVLRERDAFAHFAEMIPLPLRRESEGGNWPYTYIPEVFGDLLCEWSQLLNALVTQGTAICLLEVLGYACCLV